MWLDHILRQEGTRIWAGVFGFEPSKCLFRLLDHAGLICTVFMQIFVNFSKKRINNCAPANALVAWGFCLSLNRRLSLLNKLPNHAKNL